MQDWIKIDFSDETRDKMEKTLENCRTLDDWAIETFKKYWLAHKEIPHASTISKNVSAYIHYLPMKGETQRYTLNKTVEGSLRYFKSSLVTTENGIEYKPESTLAISNFQIQPRKVWKKYMEKYGSITTAYGNLDLEENWKTILESQVRYMGINYEWLSYLWYSATIEKEVDSWYIHFSVHGLKSQKAKAIKTKIRYQQ